MIEIKLARTEKIPEVCRRYGIGRTQGLKVYLAASGREKLGMCAFTLHGNQAEIVGLQAADAALADGLFRCALTYLLLHGAKEAVCSCGVEQWILERLGFQRGGNGWRAELSEAMFGGCESGG